VLSTVASTLLLAIRFESFVESDRALGNISVERQCEKDFRWDSLEPESAYVLESELLVVLRMSYETTAARMHVPQLCQSFADQGFANALTLVFRQNRNRSKSVPVLRAVRNDDGRERNVPNYSAICLCDKGYRLFSRSN
jgi:hypothetical protein